MILLLPCAATHTPPPASVLLTECCVWCSGFSIHGSWSAQSVKLSVMQQKEEQTSIAGTLMSPDYIHLFLFLLLLSLWESCSRLATPLTCNGCAHQCPLQPRPDSLILILYFTVCPDCLYVCLYTGNPHSCYAFSTQSVRVDVQATWICTIFQEHCSILIWLNLWFYVLRS